MALWARDPVAADRALAAITENTFGARMGSIVFTRAYAAGLVAQMKGDEDGARAAFSAARTEQEKVVRAHKAMAKHHGPLVFNNAGLSVKFFPRTPCTGRRSARSNAIQQARQSRFAIFFGSRAMMRSKIAWACP